MKMRALRLVSLLLALSLLAGCGLGSRADFVRDKLGYGDTAPTGAVQPLPEVETIQPPTGGVEPGEETGEEPPFSQMEYIRPDMDAFYDRFEQVCTLAQGEEFNPLIDAVYDFFDAYDWFYTYYSLADIRYCQDMTDGYWTEEYNYCLAESAGVDAALEELYYALAASPCRQRLEGEAYFGKGYFDAYDGENNWDQGFTDLLNREAELINAYYTLTAEGAGEDELARNLIDLVRIRREIASYWGYGSYVDFAWDFYYYRDYTPGQVADYLEAIREELVPIYRELTDTDVWNGYYDPASAEDTMAYVRSAAEHMGGTAEEAFRLLERRELCDLTWGPNKYGTSFEVWLTGWQVPFVFLCPKQTNYDKLTFAHEFGHFCNDFASQGSMAGVDVLEVLSQGMEFLSLSYADGGETLEKIKLADSLSTYVEQAAFAQFENRLYAADPEKLTVPGLYKLYSQVARDYGFDSIGYDQAEFTAIGHFYTNPLYIVSYVVSNDAALELYQLEQQEQGRGLAIYEDALDTWQSYFLAFLEESGLKSPFTQGRLEGVAEMFRRELLG